MPEGAANSAREEVVHPAWPWPSTSGVARTPEASRGGLCQGTRTFAHIPDRGDPPVHQRGLLGHLATVRKLIFASLAGLGFDQGVVLADGRAAAWRGSRVRPRSRNRTRSWRGEGPWAEWGAIAGVGGPGPIRGTAIGIYIYQRYSIWGCF